MTTSDWEFIVNQGLNTIRLPIGYVRHSLFISPDPIYAHIFAYIDTVIYSITVRKHLSLPTRISRRMERESLFLFSISPSLSNLPLYRSPTSFPASSPEPGKESSTPSRPPNLTASVSSSTSTPLQALKTPKPTPVLPPAKPTSGGTPRTSHEPLARSSS